MPLKPGASRGRAVIALKRAIVATFDDSRWRELGYLSDQIELVERHGRLLRSLYWGDPDYESCVMEVLPVVLGKGFERLEEVADFVGLQEWLARNDAALSAELYGGGDVVPLVTVEAAGKLLDINELNRHAARIRKGITDDPAQAIGSAKELVETVLKSVLGEHGEHGAGDIPALLKRAQRELDLDPTSPDPGVPGADTIRRILSNLGQVVVGVAEVRNLYGTGHGRSKARELEAAHARLVVNAAITLATFLLEVWQQRGRSG
jgi:hypothetical protein